MTTAQIKQNLQTTRSLLKQANKNLKKELEPKDYEALGEVVKLLEDTVENVESTTDKIEMLENAEKHIEKMKELLGYTDDGSEAGDGSIVKSLANLRKRFEEIGKKALTKKSIKEALNAELKNAVAGASPDFTISLKGLTKSVTLVAPNGVGVAEGIPTPEFLGVVEEIILSGNLSQIVNVGSTGMMNGTFQISKEVSEGYADWQPGLGQPKPEIKVTYELQNIVQRTLAGFIRSAKQILNDVGWLENQIISLLSRKIRKAWEAYLFEIASGTGTTYDGVTLAGSVREAQIADAIFTLATQVMTEGFDGRIGAILNPVDIAKIKVLKNLNEDYLRTDGLLEGIALIPDVNQTVGTVTVGDFELMDALANMDGANARIFEQDADNVTRNMVTILSEMHAVAWVVNDRAFVTVAYQDVIDIINSVDDNTAPQA